MKVSLLFNPDAGDGGASHELPAMIARQGHELVCVVDKEHHAEQRLLEQPCDLVVAAGGDGTVALAARIIAHRGLPMAILPFGKANNIARTFGIEGAARDLISTWPNGRYRALDVGVARGWWTPRLFVEAVGVGLMPAGISHAVSSSFEQWTQPMSNLARTAQIYRTALADLQPQRCTIRVDGERFENEYLLIEVLNTPFIGPNLVFAPDAEASDGVFSVAVAGPHEREALDEYLRHRLEGTDQPISLTRYCGRRIDIEHAGRVHIDDEVFQSASDTPITLELSGAAVEVLV